MENSGAIRAVAAWIAVVLTGIIELIAMADWAIASRDSDPLSSLPQVSNPSGFLVLFLGFGIILAAGVEPVVPGIRPLALLAFGAFGILLAWNAIFVAATYSQQLTVLHDPYGEPASTGLMVLAFHVGVAAIAAVGAFFAWRVFVANDPLAQELDDIAEQLAELEEDEDEDSATQQGEPTNESYPR